MITYRLSIRSVNLHRVHLLRLLICFAALGLCTCNSPAGNTKVSNNGGRDSGAGGSSDAAKDSKSADASVPKACQGDAGPPSKGKGESCTCDSECRTGHCVDGVCCSSTCDDKCKACNVPSALGDCSFVPSGVPPTDLSECQSSAPASCGQDGRCDGKGGCELYVADTVCDYGSCRGDGLSGIKSCDGKGACGGNTSNPCAPYSCDPKSNECDDSCTSTAQCSLGQQCASGSCGLRFNGYKCSSDSDCASEHCSGGYCCNVACNGPCVSCSLPGSLGKCQLIPAGQPSSRCDAQAQSTCGTTGYCDGAGACSLWPGQTTPCVTSSCASSVLLNTTAVCDGKGTCQDPELVDCSPYLCVAGACNSNCKSDADCQSGHACALDSSGKTGTCGKRQIGQACGNAGDCNSGQCVDGVCCESQCDGACRSCALPGSPGRCVNLPAGASDPRKTCSDGGSTACGQNGLCDGNGSCQVYPVGTKCGSASCKQGSFTDTPTCNQSGQCVAPSSRSCNPYVCNGNACSTGCAQDSDCVAPNTCVNGSCGKKQGGAQCSSKDECDSGFCAQGVCCNAECTDACEACNLPASTGFCTVVPDGTLDPQEKCEVTDKSSCGTTGACRAGACAYVDNLTVCKAAVCANTTSQTPASTCDGRGTCVTPADTSCGTFLCSNGGCLSSCKSDSDCVSPNTCASNSCGLKAKGASCTDGVQCNSGFCTEGVCCDSACSDATTASLCMSCKVSGKVGTCSAVPSGQADPKQRCKASAAANGDCSNDGTCNGKGACRPWSATTGCRQSTCSGSTYTPPANCDGNGSCSTVSSSQCNPYQCSANGESCKTTCTADTAASDCVSGETCLQTTNRCGTTLANGQLCKASSDCNSGDCVGGTCCPAGSGCFIGGVCYAANAVNPNNACQQCTPATSATAWSAKANGTKCDDGDACTQTDTCQAGTCTGGNPVTCTASDQCHSVGVCDKGSGTCSNPDKADGTACSDGNACTRTDTCQQGKCTGSNPVTCTAQDQCHSAGTCDSGTGTCSNPAKANGTSCDDGNKCTQSDTCQSGTCTAGTAVTCTASDQCHDIGACNPSTGACSNPVAANGTSCDDGDKCTQNDTCQSGTCTAGSAVTCTALDQCHEVGTCDPSSGTCSNPPASDTTLCGNNFHCSAGQCPSSCSLDTDCAPGYTCNTGTQACEQSDAGSAH